MDYVTLNNGVKMPKLGFGVFQIPDLVESEKIVTEALKAGYRLIDTAPGYLNEEAVGKSIAKSGIPREEIFVTTKLWLQDAGYEATKKAFQRQLDKLGLDYLDLYLIHVPFNDYYGSWRAMEELYKEGKIRAIGVSNFSEDRLVDLIVNNEIKPAINQIEIHPLRQQRRALEVMEEYGVQPEAWAPFAEGNGNIFQNEILKEIAEKYGKSPAQVILRWQLQRDTVVIPKSANVDRMKQNIDVFDFELSQEDMDEIKLLETGFKIIDHLTADIAKSFNEVRYPEK
ncbi:aldo/keto reductase [Enterococcus alishanensis]|uniref:Aldo/keto reductase n=2 Tax=Enterococcus alishanensis TaxID=1303817 RepID=A0ABS6TH23_9ENTE|nr:aldo/keto reductase [Enterococcus alishanensis]MBV7392225.1 aldo/keto reductase [Enterococcus alishanensis]